MINDLGAGYPKSRINHFGEEKVDHGACRYGHAHPAHPPVRSPSVPISRRPVRIDDEKVTRTGG